MSELCGLCVPEPPSGHLPLTPARSVAYELCHRVAPTHAHSTRCTYMAFHSTCTSDWLILKIEKKIFIFILFFLKGVLKGVGFWVFFGSFCMQALLTDSKPGRFCQRHPAVLARLFCKKMGNEHLKTNLERVSSLGHVTDKMLGGGGEGGFSWTFTQQAWGVGFSCIWLCSCRLQPAEHLSPFPPPKDSSWKN